MNNIKDKSVFAVYVWFVINELSFYLYMSISCNILTTVHPILKGRHVNIMFQNG
jgi:hypothetical protein